LFKIFSGIASIEIEEHQGDVMVSTDWVTSQVLEVFPDAQVEVVDLNGTGDHFHVRVISISFDGMRPLQRQKPILNHFKPHISSGDVHALDLKCMTPDQAAQAGDTTFHPHGDESPFFGVHIRRPEKK
jgi:acid stress-induced BolA-like protein IbaG/YrbA